jgi:hypothetical protein
VVHGSLNGDTVLQEDGREVGGVLAWSSLRISDPAEDLSWILGSENDPFAEAVLAAYSANRTGVDSSIRQRAVLYSEYERARWLMHGVNKGDQSIIDDAVEMLATLAGDVEAGVIGRLTAAPIAAMVAAPIIEEFSETFVSVDSDGDVELIEVNEIIEASVEEDEVSGDGDSESLETAPINVVDDKTRPIELPEKSDNELF